MQCKTRKVSAATIIDCAGIGDPLAAMPIRKLIEEAVASGEKLFIINLSGVTRLEQQFVRGLHSSKLIADRAEGALVICGLSRDTQPFFHKYGEGLVWADSEATALTLLLPRSATSGAQLQIAVLGHDRYQEVAFEGISHWRNMAVFHYHSHPEADLPRLCQLKPAIAFLNATLGQSALRTIRLTIAKASPETIFIAFGLPEHETLLRGLVTREGFDDALMIPFIGTDIALPYVDGKQFRQLLSKKIEVFEEGFYTELRRKRKLAGQ